jgi:3',5'-cyclic AMP phosphodiesterase CpdA
MLTKIPELAPDLVVCTGDHSSISEPVEFERSLAALQPLIDNPSFDLLFVPGNHDWYVKNKTCEAALADTVSKMTRGKISLDAYPLLTTIENEPFLLVNQASPQSWLSSAGGITPAAAERITTLLEQAGKPVTLISHFPLFKADGEVPSLRRHCHNNDVLVDAYRDGRIKLAMCGHIHTPFDRAGPGLGTEVCAGSLTYAAKISVIDYAKDGSFSQSWHTVR